MRILSSAATTVLAGQVVPMAVLVEMDLSSQLTLSSASIDLTLDGVTYLGTHGLGKVNTVTDSSGEMNQLQFEMAGISSADIALALAEPVQGKAVRLKVAISDPANYQVVDVRSRWTGLLDVMTVQPQGDKAALSVTAEHAGIDLLRPSVSLYSDAEQQRLYPGDLFFQYLNDLSESRIIWPASTWGRQ